MPTNTPPVGDSLLLHDMDWQTYTRLLRIFAERPSIRLTYDRGLLEIRTAPPGYLSDAALIGTLVNLLTEEMGLTVKAGRSTTFRRRRKQRGIEADYCYWIAKEPRMRGKRRLNLRVDPPPDLAIEVDVFSSSLDRLASPRPTCSSTWLSLSSWMRTPWCVRSGPGSGST